MAVTRTCAWRQSAAALGIAAPRGDRHGAHCPRSALASRAQTLAPRRTCFRTGFRSEPGRRPSARAPGYDQVVQRAARHLTLLATVGIAVGLPMGTAAGTKTTATIFQAFTSSGAPTIHIQSKSGRAAAFSKYMTAMVFLPGKCGSVISARGKLNWWDMSQKTVAAAMLARARNAPSLRRDRVALWREESASKPCGEA